MIIVTRLESKKVKNPVAVRYAYTQPSHGPYLYYNVGLPASPFSTSSHIAAKETKPSHDE
jgi:hypothetical protein